MWLPHWHGAAHVWEARGTSEISQGVKWRLSYAVEIRYRRSGNDRITINEQETRSRQVPQARVVGFFSTVGGE